LLASSWSNMLEDVAYYPLLPEDGPHLPQSWMHLSQAQKGLDGSGMARTGEDVNASFRVSNTEMQSSVQKNWTLSEQRHIMGVKTAGLTHQQGSE
ncbi:hypothetical protein DSO57_1039374, partial [Entomophthora muscae]